MADTNTVEQPAPAPQPTQKPPYFKSPEAVKNIHSDSRPRGYLPPGGGKR